MGRGIKERELMMSRVVRETSDQRGASGDSACVRTVVELLKLIESCTPGVCGIEKGRING